MPNVRHQNPALAHVARLLTFDLGSIAEAAPADQEALAAFPPAERARAAAILESFASELRSGAPKPKTTKRTAAPKKTAAAKTKK